MNIGTYFKGQLKRISKLFPGIFALSVAFAIVIGISGGLYAKYTNYNKVISKYNIGIMCEQDNPLLSVGLGLIQSIDDSRFLVNIYNYTSEEQGFEAIHNKEIKIFVVVPDDFVNNLMYQQGKPHVKLYAASQKGITTVMMDELVNLLSDDLILTSTGLYALKDELQPLSLSDEDKRYLNDKLFMAYMNSLLARSELTQINEIGLGDGLSFMGFFFCGIILFYTVMLSFCSISYFIGGRTEFFMICRAKGVRSWAQILCEYVCFFTSNLICGGFTLLCVFIIFKTGLLKIDDFAGDLVTTYLRFSLFYIFILVGLTAFEFLLFEVIRGIINKFLMAFLVLIGFSFLSGYFYPRSFLPGLANAIGKVLPTGVAYDVLSCGITGAPNMINVLKMLIYIVVFLGFVILARRVRIVKGLD
jgi:ABC-2 type transport system permease protein